jgi:leucine-zipper of insertion element IS481
MDERLQFVARRLACKAMAELCREFGISRKTSYKIFDRYQQCGVQGLTDRSSTSLSLRQPTPLSGGELHPEREARARETNGRPNNFTIMCSSWAILD